jgi:hypothetical protein
VPVSGGGDGIDGGAAIDAVIAASLRVANTLPVGSNWDGKSGLLVDEKTFNDLVGGQSPPSAR